MGELRNLATGLAVVAVLAPLAGWCLMLLLGVLHAEVSAVVPPVGFWPSVAVVVLARQVAAYTRAPLLTRR